MGGRKCPLTILGRPSMYIRDESLYLLREEDNIINLYTTCLEIRVFEYQSLQIQRKKLDFY